MMRREGADEITIIKQIAQEDSDPDTKWTRPTQDKQRYEREIAEIVKKQQQRQLDQEQQQADREPQHSQPAQREPGEQNIDKAHDATHDPSTEQAEHADRDPYIEQAIQDAQDRQQAWEQGIDPDRDNDRSFGIE
jgi:hypothetical protein